MVTVNFHPAKLAVALSHKGIYVSYQETELNKYMVWRTK